MNTPSAAQLKRASHLAEKIEELQKELAAILGQTSESGGAAKPRKAGKKKRTMSAEAREKIAAAQRKRWAKSKRAKKTEAADK